MSTPPFAWLHSIGLLGPGLPDWPHCAAILAGDTTWTPEKTVLTAPDLLPPAERRRAVRVVKLALTVGLEAVMAAGADAMQLATVFSSSGGDGVNCHQICETLASDDRQISPTRFHNSVHNAAAGYWSIATGATTPAAVLCAFDGSFGAGLLEALVQVTVDRIPCLLIAYDADYPDPLRAARPIPDAFGVAMLLSPESGDTPIGRISAQLSQDGADTLADAALECLRQSIPAARSLPLLAAIAQRKSGRVVLDYFEHARIAVEFAAESDQPATLDQAAIAARIPHQGRMCLLAGVDEWNGESIRCHATSHRDAGNPLRETWGLPATSAIEYAAQAMAVHGALLARPGDASRAGYLASVRSVEIAVDRLDTIAEPLDVRAERLTGNDNQILYTFTVAAAGRTLVSGRAAVILDAGALAGGTGSPV